MKHKKGTLFDRQKKTAAVLHRGLIGGLSALWLLTLVGCLSELKTPQDRSRNVILQIANASAFYFSNQGHWPVCLNDLKFLPSQNLMDADFRKSYDEIINTIPWEELKDNIIFKRLPNGKLSISIPQLPDKTGNPVTAIIDIPGK